jgi:predicted transposase YbfD/YdcC
MPAAPLSPLAPVLDQLAAATAGGGMRVSPGRLLEVFALVPDPRKRRGVRHRLGVLLTLATCAVLAGARSYAAIGEWAADCDEATRTVLDLGLVPDESTFRRVFALLDADRLDEALGGWAAARTTPPAGKRRHIAVDGKTLRGSRHGDTAGRHLLAALDHHSGVVLGQVDVDAKTNEIPRLRTLLDQIDITGAVITADALHTQRDTATWLIAHGAHYVFTVKTNQPALHARLAALPWKKVRTTARTVDRGHGRTETRRIRATEVRTGLGFPHAVQALQITRRRQPLDGAPPTVETVYAVTDLPTHEASPAHLAGLARQHWHIENQLHWVRDVTFAEDHSQTRTGNSPRVMASLRNLVVGILRLNGTTNIAQALRHHARRPERPIQTIMNLDC